MSAAGVPGYLPAGAHQYSGCPRVAQTNPLALSFPNDNKFILYQNPTLHDGIPLNIVYTHYILLKT
jgi:hypothetical protein